MTRVGPREELQRGEAETSELLVDEVAERAQPFRTPVFAELECSPMHLVVVASREQPFGIDGELAHDGCDGVDEEERVDDGMSIFDEAPQLLGRQHEHGREVVQAVAGLALDHGSNAIGYAFDGGVVGGRE